jgi:hypothetical protein
MVGVDLLASPRSIRASDGCVVPGCITATAAPPRGQHRPRSRSSYRPPLVISTKTMRKILGKVRVAGAMAVASGGGNARSGAAFMIVPKKGEAATHSGNVG